MKRPPRCRGFLGFFAGHKFVLKSGGATYVATSWQTVPNCLRCGMKAGIEQ